MYLKHNQGIQEGHSLVWEMGVVLGFHRKSRGVDGMEAEVGEVGV